MTGTPSPTKPVSPAKPASNQGSPARARSRSPSRPASPSKDAPATADSAPVAHPPSPKNKTPSPAKPSSSPKPPTAAAAVANGSPSKAPGSPAKEPSSPVSKSLSLDHPAASAAAASTDADAAEATPATAESKTPKRARAAAGANGSTPATASRRASTAGARKSTGGRKSTAAASLVRKDAYVIGDVVFAHVKGHPWWPARIVDDKDVPEKFLKERRTTKEHCVMFYNSGQFGFVTDEYLVPLEPNHESLGTSAAIKKGIKEALEEPDSLYEILENYKRTDVHDEIADDDEDEHDRRASSSSKSSRKSGKTPAKKAAKSPADTPARKRRAAAGEDEEADGKKSKKSKGDATPSRTSKRKAGIQAAPTQDTLMRWRHLLQKTFIKDKQIGDKPRVSAETIHTVDWDGVKTTLDEFLEYVNGADYSTEAVASTKLHKVVRLIANSSAVTDPDALLVEHDVPNKVNRLFEALRTRSEGSGNASGADAMDTAE
ncbi:hypothetical protein BCR44DRAFT_60906 [Catenaria anguillulae PL171]|uniref:PWWP domain-containing protein n=1 Tax=Catenaria anguillulae PL171 TaxID=765915 RepID=A0A1Y2H488_9FUNG|nr:hypothetical protein BCR44DRAFT_60906 [Catenaria anguillulae PL171]